MLRIQVKVFNTDNFCESTIREMIIYLMFTFRTKIIIFIPFFLNLRLENVYINVSYVIQTLIIKGNTSTKMVRDKSLSCITKNIIYKTS